jgi:alkylated DNA repair dioxygenase AlkB
MDVLFDQPLARQVILNLYPPGQGISPHIDLSNRYADGIIGVSLLGGCTMVFERDGERYDVYRPERTVYVLTGEARWEWSHGIEGRLEDKVRGKGEEEVETRLRSTRVSVTFRWMRDGADVLA